MRVSWRGWTVREDERHQMDKVPHPHAIVRAIAGNDDSTLTVSAVDCGANRLEATDSLIGKMPKGVFPANGDNQHLRRHFPEKSLGRSVGTAVTSGSQDLSL